MKRDCTHPIARHEHGTRNAYILDRCRCDDCRIANTLSERHRTRQKAYGRYDGLVDAEPVRERIRLLSEHGVGLKQITRLSGVSGGVLTKLVYGAPREDGTRRPPSRRCTPRVRDRIMAVPLDGHADHALVDATGTRRRLQALVAVGWSQCKLAERLGMARANFGKTMKADQVYAETARAVRELYDTLWNAAPPHAVHRDRIAYSRSKRLASVRGWSPPLAWDDDTIDNPGACPQRSLGPDDARCDIREYVDQIAIERRIAGDPIDLTIAELAEAVRVLYAKGETRTAIARRLAMSGSRVNQIVSEEAA